MRFHLIPVAIAIYAGAFVGYLNAQTPPPGADEVVATMLGREAAREAASGGYIGRREYTLENQQFHKRADMLVNITCDGNGMKHFDVLVEDGWKSANQRVLRQLVETESDRSRPEIRAKSRITSENYSFRMLETGLLEGRMAHVIEVIPKRDDEALFHGRIWVDTEDYALVRVEGEPAKNPSFWTRKVHFVQQYHKSGKFWFPLLTTSVTDARIFGTTEVTIRYSDYKPLAESPNLPPAPSILEAQNARHYPLH